MLNNVKIKFLFLSLIISALLLTTCDTPLGMGNPIDWEPPVLTLSPKPPTPMYVNLGAQLTGTVTDNVAVDRVILRDSTTGAHLFTATLLPNDRWLIKLDFSPDQNGETILADVVAYDKNGNSGAESIASVVLIIDIRPPIVDDVWIQRTNIRTQDLLPYNELKDLERGDPRGEVRDNVNKYQNGAFSIKAQISEEDTTIEKVELQIYDSNYPDIPVVSMELDEKISKYNPSWNLTEDIILDEGITQLRLPNYKTDYKTLNKRYYYRLRIIATDKSNNPSIEDQNYFCLWNEADNPKGVLDTRVVGSGTDITQTKGSLLPVEFFDDDRIEWAFAALFTKEQWAGTNNIASGVKLPASDDNAKFAALQERLLAKQEVFNWRYDSDRAKSNPESEPVENVITSPDGADEKTYYIGTGNDPSDFGEFVLVTLVKDKKLSPHVPGEYPDITIYRKYNVNLIDENAPLIVFDKKGNPPTLPGSPEENTFPSLTTDGKFTIHGYTLREDRSGTGANKVLKFRLAWVPFNISGGPEENIPAVKTALEKGSDFPAGVQWWDLSADVAGNGAYSDLAGGGVYWQQNFTKTFSILGAEDLDKPEYDNFTISKGNKTTFENTTKLFVFFAEDNMGHTVFTQFYLLGNKTPPTIDIYDITDRLTMTYTSNDDANSPPSIYDYAATPGNLTTTYREARRIFNENKYSALKSVSEDGSGNIYDAVEEQNKITESYKVYPRGTVVKFWTKAQKPGQLTIKNISMSDADSVSAGLDNVGFFKNTDYRMSYVEYFPDVTQRVFTFTAEDSLGNTARVQRTIAIASAATLTSITTPKQNGTYPANEVIELRANFDGLIKLQNLTNGTRPKLNVLYNINSTPTVQQIECEPDAALLTTGQLSLIFKFTVPVNAGGQLLTIYQGLANPNSLTQPLTVSSSNKIMDAKDNGGEAYTPGNVTGFFWDTAVHSLQDPTNGKNIQLDGVAPRITNINIVDTKDAYAGETNKWYLKSGESITFKMTSSKSLKVTGSAALRFRLQRPNSLGYTAYNTTAFDYRKVTGNDIYFTLDVNNTNISQDGILQNDITLVNASNIIDDVGNPLDTNSFTTALTAFNISNNGTGTGKTIYFDLTPPGKPVTNLTGATTISVGSTPTQTINYNTSPYMEIADAATANEPWGTAKKQYSLNGGLYWVDFPSAINSGEYPWTSVRNTTSLNILNGQWSLKTRYIDKAGNEGQTTDQLIYINNVFPKLLAVNVLQPNATYMGGNTLQFTLDFEDTVTAPASGVTLTLRDMSVTTNTPGGLNNTYEITLTAAAVTNNRTVTFTWSLANNTKDMLNGLQITGLSISGLTDKFGNSGPSTGITLTSANVTVSGSLAPYDFSKVIVSTITPTVRSREPQHAGNRTGNITLFTADPDNPPSTPDTAIVLGSISVDNKTIKLNFSKPMDKGNGTITIRPHAGYAIPAVFDNDEFNTVFNNGTDTDKNNLVGSTSMSAPALVQETGLSAGPYLKTTHGLKQGAGFTGNYTNSGNYYASGGAQPSTPATNPGTDAPGARGTDRMVPDLSLKWVLRYNITNIFDTTANSDVSKIRTALDNAKWRWQEIPVSSSEVTFSGNSVIIRLQQALPDGLQWDVFYGDGTFQDKAGNKAAGITRGAYWFWTKGAQKPVVRVDRKSYDARPAGNYAGDIVGKAGYNDTNAYSGNIASFNTVNYIITSETPQARIFSGKITGADGTGSITGAWTGTAGTGSAARTWNGTNGSKPTTQVLGDWVRPNLIFRHGNDANTGFDGNYNYLKEPGISIARKLGGSTDGSMIDTNRYYGFRSYNKDATITEINGVSIGDVNGQAYAQYVTDNFTYAALQASKNYVVAIARIDHKTTATNGTNTYNTANYSSDRGYEGVFRTVIAMNQSAITGNNGANPMTDGSHPMLIAGTDARSGLPTVPGFPLKDGVHRNDSRFVKVFYRGTNNETATGMIQTPTNAFYWVTTEMVTQWYLQLVGDGAAGTTSYSKQGDVEDWVSAGYGDLSYALNLATW